MVWGRKELQWGVLGVEGSPVPRLPGGACRLP